MTVVSIALSVFTAPIHSYASYDSSSALSLPWALTSTWYWNGPHNWSDTQSQPWNSLDLNGNSGSGQYQVLAAHGGIVHLDGCSSSGGYVRVDEGDGWQITYYHVSSLPTKIVEGATVARGELLG